MARDQRQEPGLRDLQAHKGSRAISGLVNYPSMVRYVILLISYLGIGQSLGLIGFTSKSYWFGLVWGLKPKPTKPTSSLVPLTYFEHKDRRIQF